MTAGRGAYRVHAGGDVKRRWAGGSTVDDDVVERPRRIEEVSEQAWLLISVREADE